MIVKVSADFARGKTATVEVNGHLYVGTILDATAGVERGRETGANPTVRVALVMTCAEDDGSLSAEGLLGVDEGVSDE